jgi:hypothetical protein
MSSGRRNEAESAIKKLNNNFKKTLRKYENKLPQREKYVKYTPRINYNEDGTVKGYSFNPEIIERTAPVFLHAIIEPDFEQTTDYNKTLTLLSEIYKEPKEHIQSLLSAFLTNEVNGGIHGDLGQLLDDLEGKPALFHVTALMKGIVPEEQELDLADGVKLRRVREEDLIYEVQPYSLQYDRHFSSFPHSVLEIGYKTQYEREIQEKIERLIILFSLYRETPAYYERYSIRTKSYGKMGGTISRTVPYAGEPKIIIKKSDVDCLKAFIDYFEPRIPSALIFGQPMDPLEVAIKRYLESLRENVGVEEKLTRAVMGLEALFLENESELKFRLGLRTAQLTGYLNEDPSTVYKIVSEAYEYRSSHVHGSVLSSDKQVKAREVLAHVWRYLRKAILIWIVEDISSEAKKRLFLKRIDESLIDENSRLSFKSEIQSKRSVLSGAI